MVLVCFCGTEHNLNSECEYIYICVCEYGFVFLGDLNFKAEKFDSGEADSRNIP